MPLCNDRVSEWRRSVVRDHFLYTQPYMPILSILNIIIHSECRLMKRRQQPDVGRNFNTHTSFAIYLPCRIETLYHSVGIFSVHLGPLALEEDWTILVRAKHIMCQGALAPLTAGP